MQSKLKEATHMPDIFQADGEVERKGWSLKFAALWFNCFIVWTFVIKQIMHFFIISIILTAYSSGRKSITHDSSATLIRKTNTQVSPDLDILKYSKDGLDGSSAVVEVPEGSLAVLECRLSNISSLLTVSWLRLSDVSVLTVGSLVFSSDPRIAVVTGQTAGTWRLLIRQVTTRDMGEYQCQANTEPKESAVVRLLVKGEENAGIEVKEELIAQIGQHFQMKETRKHQVIESEQNIPAEDISHKQTFQSFSFINISSLNNTINEREMKKEASELSNQTYSDIDKTAIEVERSRTPNDQIAKVEENVLQNIVEENATINTEDTSKDSSLLVPILSLILVGILVIVLGSIRIVYSNFITDKHQPSRSSSRTGTIDSRRSSGSRRSEDSKIKKRQKGRKFNKDKLFIDSDVIHKHRLSPVGDTAGKNFKSDNYIVNERSEKKIRKGGPENQIENYYYNPFEDSSDESRQLTFDMNPFEELSDQNEQRRKKNPFND